MSLGPAKWHKDWIPGQARNDGNGLFNNQRSIDDALNKWDRQQNTHRLWGKDSSLWTCSDEASWLDWLDIAKVQQNQVEAINKFVQELKSDGFTDAVILGMGGSSLCPFVMAETFGKKPGFLNLHILDSTDPAQIANLEQKLSYQSTVFIVSSKSGSTLEPNTFFKYFWAQSLANLSEQEASKHFAAITDPDSSLDRLASELNFRQVFYGLASIGGRFSALSNFGLMPAACLGIDISKILYGTEKMMHACAPSIMAHENHGVLLGVTLGTLAKRGKDKVTLITSPKLKHLGAWLEQLIAESTGKNQTGLIPVDGEVLMSPEHYGNDRIFVSIAVENDQDSAQKNALQRLQKAGHPIINLKIKDIDQIGAEFFRWEFAVAVTSHILGINAFNQPDVEVAKIKARALTDKFEEQGHLSEEKPLFKSNNIWLFGKQAKLANKSLKSYLQNFLNKLKTGNYFAVLAFIDMNRQNKTILQSLRQKIAQKTGLAATLGFGPRFLHSTGQIHKGGPNSGLFLQITCQDVKSLEVPECAYSFSIVKQAQARGDFEALLEAKRRILRVHLMGDLKSGLKELENAFKEVLESKVYPFEQI